MSTLSRRIFVSCNEKIYKLFNITQNVTDGSFYFAGFKKFPQIKWISVAPQDGQLNLGFSNSTPNDGKLTIHGSGFSGFREHNKPHEHQLIVKGNYLYDSKNQALGARHLLTLYMEQLLEMPSNGFPNRKSDWYINNQNQNLEPFTLVLFAIPKAEGISEIEINVNFDFEKYGFSPLNNGGFGLIEFRYHQIAWWVYQTEKMKSWANESYVSYGDGFYVPLIMGQTGDQENKVIYQICSPEYTIQNKVFSLGLRFV